MTASDWRGQAGSGRLGKDHVTGHVEDFSIWVDDLAALWLHDAEHAGSEVVLQVVHHAGVYHPPSAVNSGERECLARGQDVRKHGPGVHLVVNGGEEQERAGALELWNPCQVLADALAGGAACRVAQGVEASSDFFSRVRFLHASSLSFICFS